MFGNANFDEDIVCLILKSKAHNITLQAFLYLLLENYT